MEIFRRLSYKKWKYKGQFLNGKRNGKGKEYIYKYEHYFQNDATYLLFDGEYINNSRVKGKEYYENGNLKFEGEYLFNRKWGGKGYDINGNILYELKNGNGYVEEDNKKKIIKIFYGENIDKNNINLKRMGKEYNFDGKLIFDGEYLWNRRLKGKYNEYYENELVLVGEYLHSELWTGKGKQYNLGDGLIFDGEYIDGKKNGYVKVFDCMHYLEYEGQYKNGEKNGLGKNYYYNNIISYEGEFLSGKKNGFGKDYDSKGKLLFEGNYVKGERNGYGKEFYKNDLLFEGEYVNNKKWNGKGKEYEMIIWGEETLAFEGEYLNGKKNGKGKEFYNNGGIKFEGEYKNGERNGFGKEYNRDGSIKYVGEFLDGNYIDTD